MEIVFSYQNVILPSRTGVPPFLAARTVSEAKDLYDAMRDSSVTMNVPSHRPEAVSLRESDMEL